MRDESWLSVESRMTTVARRAYARGLRRRNLVLALALLGTAAYAASRVLRSPTYEATLAFRMVEGDLTDVKNAPPPPRAIRDHILSVALSLTKAEQIMNKYQLQDRYFRPGASLERDRVTAINLFRDDIAVGVNRNYFIYDRRPDDPPRSAQVTISFSALDPEQARAVLHEIGDAVVRDQTAQRSGRLLQAREFLGAQLGEARARATSLLQEVERLGRDQAKGGQAGAPAIQAQIATRAVEAQAALERVLTLERRDAEIAYSSAVEGGRLGLSFELFDESLEVYAPRLAPAQLARRSAIAFVLLLLLIAPVIGAFDDRIYAPEDLAASGLPSFGALPRFPGDDAGSYRERTLAHRA